VIAVVLCAALAIAAVAAREVRHGEPPSPYQAPPATYHAKASFRATVSVEVSGKVTGGIGDQFVGLSFESSTLNNGYRYDNVGNLAQLLRNLGRSVIRFGGNTADTSFTGINPAALAGLARLAKATGWSVLYTENLAKFNAAQVTADARAVSAALGSRLFGFACGNEPDQFAVAHLRPSGYTFGDYLAQETACFRAIRKAAPRAPLEGPDTAWSQAWLAEYAVREAGTISSLGQHYYPLGCAKAGDKPAALVATLLSPALARREAANFTRYVAAAAAARVPLIISETNSACGGGISGLSNAYASGLWVIDYLLTGAEHGVYAMDFHGGLNTLCAGYTVLCQVGPNDYRPQPIYYGMLFTHLLGTGKFLPVKVSWSSPAGNIAAFALKPSRGGGLRLMVVNLSGDQADTTLGVGGYRGAATVLRLTGPSPLATSGVAIQGASAAANGTVTPGRPGAVTCTSHGCPVTIGGYSAVLVTLG
jgi:hypothetical protein